MKAANNIYFDGLREDADEIIAEYVSMRANGADDDEVREALEDETTNEPIPTERLIYTVENTISVDASDPRTGYAYATTWDAYTLRSAYDNGYPFWRKISGGKVSDWATNRTFDESARSSVEAQFRDAIALDLESDSAVIPADERRLVGQRVVQYLLGGDRRRVLMTIGLLDRSAQMGPDRTVQVWKILSECAGMRAHPGWERTNDREYTERLARFFANLSERPIIPRQVDVIGGCNVWGLARALSFNESLAPGIAFYQISAMVRTEYGCRFRHARGEVWSRLVRDLFSRNDAENVEFLSKIIAVANGAIRDKNAEVVRNDMACFFSALGTSDSIDTYVYDVLRIIDEFDDELARGRCFAVYLRNYGLSNLYALESSKCPSFRYLSSDGIRKVEMGDYLVYGAAYAAIRGELTMRWLDAFKGTSLFFNPMHPDYYNIYASFLKTKLRKANAAYSKLTGILSQTRLTRSSRNQFDRKKIDL